MEQYILAEQSILAFFSRAAVRSSPHRRPKRDASKGHSNSSAKQTSSGHKIKINSTMIKARKGKGSESDEDVWPKPRKRSAIGTSRDGELTKQEFS